MRTRELMRIVARHQNAHHAAYINACRLLEDMTESTHIADQNTIQQTGLDKMRCYAAYLAVDDLRKAIEAEATGEFLQKRKVT